MEALRKNYRIDGVIEGNSKCFQGLCSYYLLNSGHSAPADNPSMGVAMLLETVNLS